MTEAIAPVETPPEDRQESRALAEVGHAAAVAREEAEIKAALYLARTYPRNEIDAHTKVIRACERPSFAERAIYSFPRGGQTVKGPSVHLAREIARQLGNIRYGFRVVTMDEDTVHIRAYAHDLETNTYVESEDRFARLVQRKIGGVTRWVAPDERDLRELVNRRAAILIRNCILQLAPADMVDEAVRAVHLTLRKAAEGEIKQSREETIRRLALAFSELGVTVAMLEQYLGHPLETITADEIADLRGVYRSIADGNSKVSDHFDLSAGRAQAAAATQELNQRLAEVPAQASAPAAPGPSPEPVASAPVPEAESKKAEAGTGRGKRTPQGGLL